MKKTKILLFIADEGLGYAWLPYPYMIMGPILKRAGFEPVVVDQRVQKNWQEIIDEHVAEFLWAGFTLMIGNSIGKSLQVADSLKKKRKDLPLVFGGWWPSTAVKLMLSHPSVDMVVVGAGDNVVVPISKYFQNSNGELGSSVFTKKDLPSLNHDFKSLAPITPAIKSDWEMAYEIIPDVDLYRSRNNIMALFGALSCPYGKCTYCSIVQHYKFKIRDHADIINEIEFLTREKGFESILFLDGLFFTGRKILDLVQGFLDRDIKMNWVAKARSDSLQRYKSKDLELIKNSGCRRVSVGVESGSDRMLKIMNKGVKNEHTFSLAKLCRDNDFELSTNFLFGLPGEKPDDLRRSIETINEVYNITGNFFCAVGFFVPTPGTRAFTSWVDMGGIPPKTLDGWSNLTWRSEPCSGINKLPWLSNKERDEYIKIYHDYFNSEGQVLSKYGQLKRISVDAEENNYKGSLVKSETLKFSYPGDN